MFTFALHIVGIWMVDTVKYQHSILHANMTSNNIPLFSISHLLMHVNCVEPHVAVIPYGLAQILKIP